MKLIRETLTNFMGIRSFTFEPNGKTAEIFGNNGAGKTTLFSAFNWVLFNKDSTGKEPEGKGFKLKTLDADGKAIPMIDHSVELVLEHDGKRFTLKKTFSEKWTKKRGTATAEFTGHETAFEIDGVPKSQKDFDRFLSTLCDESLLRMLTDPDYFPGKMDWKDRRRILMDICGDISDADVIASNSKLTGLTAILAGRDIEDHRKVLAAQKTRLNDEIKMIPVRVDEATRALPDTEGLKLDALKLDLQKAKGNLNTTETSLLELEQGGAATEKRLRIRQIEAEILDAQNKADEAKQIGIRAKSREQNDLQIKRDTATRSMNTANSQIYQLTETLSAIEKMIDDKRKEWVAEDARTLDLDSAVAGTCPTCGQAIPEEQVQAAKEKAQADFNLKKSETLSAISESGEALKAKKQATESELATITATIPALEKEIKSLYEQIDGIRESITAERETVVAESVEVRALYQELEKLKAEIEQNETDNSDEKTKLTEIRDNLRRMVAGIESDIAKFALREQGEKRITELKAREKELAREYEGLEQQTFLTEEFIRAKVQLLESKINGKFQMARFQMFAEQVNGGLSEVCEVLGPDGVPYSKGLNNAAKINTGLDIVNSLSAHFGFTAPVIIDNAESVTQIIDTDAQQIRLVVSAGDEKLRVEVR